jgi:mono/diheme cytochrome c family protein
MLKKAKTRLLTRVAQNCCSVLARVYRAATVRESVSFGAQRSLPLVYLRIWGAIALLASGSVLLVSGDAPAKLTRDEAQKLKSPVANSKKSIARGRVIFMQNCTSCHGEDGKAEGSLVASATDLTSPQLYKSGTSEGEIFHSIRDGAGDQMPAFKGQIDSENDIWNLVNFIRSLWPAAERPAVQDDSK